MALKPPDARNAPSAGRNGWFSRRAKSPPSLAAKPRRTRFGFSSSYSRGDIALFASGIVLSAFCASFPWYVFMNQDKFSAPKVTLGNIPSSGRAPINWNPTERTGEDSLAETSQDNDVDTFTTGTTPPASEEVDAPVVVRQPFPAGPPPEFELVHVANGRAMIQDDKGLYVVQRGSLLPDNSFVARIENRDGRWVLVTTADRVLEIVD